MTRLRQWPDQMRWLAAAFVLVMMVGYGAGLSFIAYNTGFSGDGVVDHYQGNEDRMKFGKSTGEMLEIVHTHILGMGLLFFAVGILFVHCDFPLRIRGLIVIETMLTLLTTFGGLWLVSSGWTPAIWIVFPSSIAMVFGYVVMSVTVIWNCLTPESAGS